MRLRVLTINVQHDEGHPRRTSQLNRELQRLSAGLVALQEVCYPGQWDRWIDGPQVQVQMQRSAVGTPRQ